ncbi:MAG TPA: hypothetical protein VNA27_01965 [Rubrobacteraceae bacterium]|nr:hypothetical protein [Rubrobacteraceae bacterium]
MKILKKSGVALVLVGAAYMSLTPAAFAQDMFQADLDPLNNSGASGTANLALEGDQLTTDIASEGLAPGLPHAQHIYGLEQAMSECPTILNDQNGDNLVNTTEGEPSYGPILTSLTTEGDTSPESALAVDRFPVANEDGTLTYDRTFGVPTNVADRLEEFAIVQHGVDLNGNGVYDEEAAGPSDLDPSLPQEATIPANCGVIEPVSG